MRASKIETPHGFNVVTVKDLWKDVQARPLSKELDPQRWYAEKSIPLQKALVAALGKHWPTIDDNRQWDIEPKIIVSGMWVHNWSIVGGIYAIEPCCPRFVSTVSEVLGQSSDAELWSYNSCIEEIDEEPPPFLNKSILIKHGTLYLEDDGVDYSRFYI